jgi:DNA-binding winged helix-turn-helix (wHTH) protein
MAAERAISAYRFGKFLLNVVEHVLWRGNERVSLTPKEFDTLHVLVARAGHVVGKEELLRAVWPDAFVAETNLTRNVSVLRKRLGAGAIKTISKRGYCFALAVEPEGELSTEPMIRVPSLAVLPFANMSGDEKLDAWVHAVCEETIEKLVQSLRDILPVVSLATLVRYQETAKSPREAAEDLRVEYLLTGWVRSEAGALRLHVEIVNARTFTFVWVTSFHVRREQESTLDASLGTRIAQEAKTALLPRAIASGDGSVAAEAGQD